MKFHESVSLEKRDVLLQQLRKYEKEVTMTIEERRDLYEWVADGESPYDNGYNINGENGWPMDFVSAMRFVSDQTDWFMDLSKEEQQKLRGSADQAMEKDGFFPISEENIESIFGQKMKGKIWERQS